MILFPFGQSMPSAYAAGTVRKLESLSASQKIKEFFRMFEGDLTDVIEGKRL